MQSQSRGSWSLVLPRRLPAVLADREQLTAAVCHVLDAAARADTQGGVVLTARTAPTSVRVTVTAVADPSADPRSGEAEGAGRRAARLPHGRSRGRSSAAGRGHGYGYGAH
ncbi:hypothetical protein ACFPH6_17765 [Streptomyces xiangluensis]|uniref:Uncharacterized protein n=1 Tax=Streptomyces xiangluensis TaxID=2665720 RepID=A0ABV8YP56_9ACTN